MAKKKIVCLIPTAREKRRWYPYKTGEKMYVQITSETKHSRFGKIGGKGKKYSFLKSKWKKVKC